MFESWYVYTHTHVFSQAYVSSICSNNRALTNFRTFNNDKGGLDQLLLLVMVVRVVKAKNVIEARAYDLHLQSLPRLRILLKIIVLLADPELD